MPLDSTAVRYGEGYRRTASSGKGVTCELVVGAAVTKSGKLSSEASLMNVRLDSSMFESLQYFLGNPRAALERSCHSRRLIFIRRLSGEEHGALQGLRENAASITTPNTE